MEANIYVIVSIGLASLFGLWVIFYFIPVGTFFTARLSGVDISLVQMILMRFRKTPPELIVREMIKSNKAGINIDMDMLEAHYLAGGNIDNVVNGLIYAKARNLELSFKQAAQLDLSRKDIVHELNNKKEII